MSGADTAVVVGVGPGLGLSVVRACTNSGMQVIAAARQRDRLVRLIGGMGPAVRAVACDATREADVEDLFSLD